MRHFRHGRQGVAGPEHRPATRAKFFHDSSKNRVEVGRIVGSAVESGPSEIHPSCERIDDLRASSPATGLVVFRLRISVGTPPNLPDFFQFCFSSPFVAPLLPPTRPRCSSNRIAWLSDAGDRCM